MTWIFVLPKLEACSMAVEEELLTVLLVVEIGHQGGASLLELAAVFHFPVFDCL
jgi:hypothetical protein